MKFADGNFNVEVLLTEDITWKEMTNGVIGIGLNSIIPTAR